MIELGEAILYKYAPYPTNKHRALYHSAAHRAEYKRLGLWQEFGFYRPDVYRNLGHKKSP
jgi:endonuclease YncB( thermonuclease family)